MGRFSGRSLMLTGGASATLEEQQSRTLALQSDPSLLPAPFEFQPFDLFVKLALRAEGAFDVFLCERGGIHHRVVSLIEQLIPQTSGLAERDER